MNIDTVRLVADLKELAAKSRGLKTLLGATWTRPMADEQKELVRVRRSTTELCVLRAFARGRSHTRESHEWHARVAERVAKDYTTVEEVEKEEKAS